MGVRQGKQMRCFCSAQEPSSVLYRENCTELMRERERERERTQRIYMIIDKGSVKWKMGNWKNP